MGAEFISVVAAISDSGHSISKALSYGVTKYDLFDQNFSQHFRSPFFICTDAKYEYIRYCQNKGYNQYIRPRNNLKTLDKNGYVKRADYNTTNPVDIEKIKAKNKQILERLYKEELIDFIYPQRLTFVNFNNLKKTYNLNLSRINGLHADIKHFINVDMKSVSTRYINLYLGVFNFAKNFKVDHGRAPATYEDAENILIEILKKKIHVTNDDIGNMEFDLEKPSYRASRILEEKTNKARRVTGNIYLKFDTADGIPSFSIRAFLETLSLYRLKEITKPLKIKGYTTKEMTKWKLTRLIEKHPDAEEEIFKYIHNNKLEQISEEDMKVINSMKYTY